MSSEVFDPMDDQVIAGPLVVDIVSCLQDCCRLLDQQDSPDHDAVRERVRALLQLVAGASSIVRRDGNTKSAVMGISTSAEVHDRKAVTQQICSDYGPAVTTCPTCLSGVAPVLDDDGCWHHRTDTTDEICADDFARAARFGRMTIPTESQ